MPIQGTYDKEAIDICAATHAGAVILIVFDGDKAEGTSASVKVVDPRWLSSLPFVLRTAANDLDRLMHG